MASTDGPPEPEGRCKRARRGPVLFVAEPANGRACAWSVRNLAEKTFEVRALLRLCGPPRAHSPPGPACDLTRVCRARRRRLRLWLPPLPRLRR